MAVCSIGSIVSSSKKCSNGLTCLKNLTIPVDSHLYKCKISDTIESEGHLIALRAGVFDQSWLYLTVCEFHKSSLGINWIPRERSRCHYPDHQGKGKPERHLNAVQSREIYQLYGTVVPVGTGDC